MRLGILLSGRGSNFVAIAESIRTGRLSGVEIAVVISNVAEAGGLQAAREHGAAAQGAGFKGTQTRRARRGDDCVPQGTRCGPGLPGWVHATSVAGFVGAFRDRILNIHPSLLPAFPGLEAQEQAFAYGVKVAGCTVHFVDDELDHGVIVVQRVIPVLESDDAHSLADRILKEEHVAYSEAIGLVTSGEYGICGRRFVKREA